MSSDSPRLQLQKIIRREVPERPGVYTWLGELGEPLYVGKSVRLRSRMLSYLLPHQLDPGSRHRHLAASIHAFHYRETAGELLALLLEDLLIKQLRPRHNVRQRDYLERRYLLLTADPYPACLVVESEPPRPGTLFGPFKDQYFVAELIGLITDEFGLRACQDRHPFRRSARFDLGACSGPCRGDVSEMDYASIVERVRGFLAGDDSWIAARLNAAMEEASECLRFERAAEARERLAFCRRFAARQTFIRAFCEHEFVIGEERFGLTYHFERGWLRQVTGRGGVALPIPVGLDTPLEDRRFLLDRANLVYAWVQRHATPSASSTAPLRQHRPQTTLDDFLRLPHDA